MPPPIRPPVGAGLLPGAPPEATTTPPIGVRGGAPALPAALGLPRNARSALMSASGMSLNDGMPGRPPVTTSRMTFGPMRVVMPTSDLTLTPFPSSVGMWHDWHRST
jgi:hypothetical protein